jgi:hypothetical protein
MAAKGGKSDDRLRSVKKAAVLRSQGYKQARIAALLGVSQATVSKLLKAAKKEERILLPRRPVCLLGGAEIRQIVRELFDLSGLVGALGKLADRERWPREIPEANFHVFWAGRDTKEPPGQDYAVKNWGPAAAAAVHAILERCATASLKGREKVPGRRENSPPLVGVTWGRHVRSVTDGLMHLDLQKRRLSSPVEFIPLWGMRLSVRKPHDESVFTDHLALSSNALVRDLHKALCPAQGDNVPESPAVKHFLPVFDLIPFDPDIADFGHASTAGDRQVRKREGDWLRGVKRAFSLIPSYRAIFGNSADDEGALANQLTAVLTSLGPPGRSRSFSPDGGDYGGVPQWWTEAFSHGDVGGVLLPKEPGEIEKVLEGLKIRTSVAQVNQQFSRLAEHWAGVQLPHISRCAAGANGATRPGVIGLAVGEDRAITVLTALRRGLLNHLIIDPDLGRQLLKLAEGSLMKPGDHFGSSESTT